MPNHARLLHSKNGFEGQRGQALLAMLVILVLGLSAAIYALVSPTRSTVERDKITAAALAQAKAALIGYAVGVDLNSGRPGDLPCPDTVDNGQTGASCGNAAGTTGQTSRIGRLPWRSLGLPDLRDGDGERLWYAVSNNFKYNNRTTCTSPGATGCLNSDTRGTITVRNSAGTVIHNGANPDAFTPSGVIAVIFAPGGVLQRQDTGTTQIRDCSGAGCVAVTGVCNSTTTPKCNPVNYLDVLNGVEDNSIFTDSSNSDGFINGVIRDASGNLIVNDRLITITYEDLMPALQRRVAKEALNCLTTYASTAQNNGRYPWAVPVENYPVFTDQVNTLFGRIPDSPFGATFLGLGGAVSTLVCQTLGLTALCMRSNWSSASCGISQGTWWTNWKDMVFYGVANASKPADTLASLLGIPAASNCTGTNCLLINPPSPTADKRVAVVVAGKRLSGVNGGQPRSSTTNKQDPANYLEGENGNNNATSYIYEDSPTSTTFNDIVLYQ